MKLSFFKKPVSLILAGAKAGYSLDELRLLNVCLSIAQSTQQNDIKAPVFFLSMATARDICGTRAAIKKILFRLTHVPFTASENAGPALLYVEKHAGGFSFGLSPHMCDIFSPEIYAPISLSYVAKAKSARALIFYEMAMLYANRKNATWEITPGELIATLGLPGGYEKRLDNFRQRVIDVAIADINASSPILLSYETIFRGRGHTAQSTTRHTQAPLLRFFVAQKSSLSPEAALLRPIMASPRVVFSAPDVHTNKDTNKGAKNPTIATTRFLPPDIANRVRRILQRHELPTNPDVHYVAWHAWLARLTEHEKTLLQDKFISWVALNSALQTYGLPYTMVANDGVDEDEATALAKYQLSQIYQKSLIKPECSAKSPPPRHRPKTRIIRPCFSHSWATTTPRPGEATLALVSRTLGLSRESIEALIGEWQNILIPTQNPAFATMAAQNSDTCFLGWFLDKMVTRHYDIPKIRGTKNWLPRQILVGQIEEAQKARGGDKPHDAILAYLFLVAIQRDIMGILHDASKIIGKPDYDGHPGARNKLWRLIARQRFGVWVFNLDEEAAAFLAQIPAKEEQRRKNKELRLSFAKSGRYGRLAMSPTVLEAAAQNEFSSDSLYLAEQVLLDKPSNIMADMPNSLPLPRVLLEVASELPLWGATLPALHDNVCRDSLFNAYVNESASALATAKPKLREKFSTWVEAIKTGQVSCPLDCSLDFALWKTRRRVEKSMSVFG